MIRIYNSLTRQLEDFHPLYKDYVTIYNCGPTVYDYFHIGNARNFITFDNIRRYLIHKGYKVKFIQNITDIEDKIIQKAQEEKVPVEHITEKYTRYFFDCRDQLGIMPADYHPRATDMVPFMIDMIKGLIERGHAYEKEGDVLFSVQSFDGYGKLSGKKLEDLREGTRKKVRSAKEAMHDFVLWKKYKPGEPYWDSPWGKGRPGWHLECSAMSMKYLGETIDIHGGGTDLQFPHHENEVAQSEAFTQKPFVRYWMHNGFLIIDGEKMSKSLGNFFIINDVLQNYSPQTIRFFMCMSHYRKPLEYQQGVMKNAQKGFIHINECYQFLKEHFTSDEFSPGALSEELFQYRYLLPERLNEYFDVLFEYIDEFENAMDDDFNFPQAIGALFNSIKFLNTHLRKDGVSDLHEKAAYGYAFLNTLAGILGLSDPEHNRSAAGDSDEFSQIMELVLSTRRELRNMKAFDLADSIRDRLKDMGISIKDTPEKTLWSK